MVEGKLNFSTKFAFGVGQAGEGVFNSGLAFFLLFYYSQILELNPGTWRVCDPAGCALM